MFPRVTFVTGGAASGKSAFAEALTARSGKARVYLATARPWDAEMRRKIAIHAQRRGPDWAVIEASHDLGPTLSALSGAQIGLIDCATMWLNNHLMDDSDIEQAQRDLLAAISTCAANLVIVSNEVGGGIVPDNALARRFREAQGRLNIALAAQADLAVLVAAGLPLVLKGQLP